MPSAQLHLVQGGQLPDPPYPPDIKARGWAFDIHYETLDQSSTWKLASRALEARPWLLLLWLQSWREIPCGTLPDDDEIIAASVGCSLPFFKQHRDLLMRGWRAHSDGLLYHDTITKNVLRMIAARQKDRQRVSEWRKKNQQLAANAAHLLDVGYALPTREYDTHPHPHPHPLLKDAVPSELSIADAPDCPHVELIERFHAALPTCPRVDAERWNGTEQRKMRTRWREAWDWERKKNRPNDKAALLDWFGRLFAFCAESKFLMSKIPGRNGQPPFELKLQWLICPKNFHRVLDGDFHRSDK